MKRFFVCGLNAWHLFFLFIFWFAEKPMRPFTLLCTYGSNLAKDMKFPPRGTCDFIFYDSLYCPIHHNRIGSVYTGSFANFMARAALPSTIQMGISVSYK